MKRGSSFFVVLCVIGSSLSAQALPAAQARVLKEYSDAFAALAAEVKPAVVAIKTETEMAATGHDQYRGTPFEDFFGQHPFFKQQPGKNGPRMGLGSGVIASDKGYILTNNHVIAAGGDDVVDRITVELPDKRSFEAQVVGRDPLTDIAVLKIDATDLTAIPFGDSDALRVGELVVALGSPFGQLHTVTSGWVSALGRASRGTHYEEYIQTDAAINPGNSGGALVNSAGELIGINTAIVSRSGGYDGIGFAIPSNLVRNVMDQLIEHGQVRRGLLGIHIQEVTDDLSKSMGLDRPHGVLVSDVNEDSAADEAGLAVGDVILKVDGQTTDSVAELRNTIAHTAPGTKVKLLVWRDGKERSFTATLTALDDARELARAPSQRHSERLGLRVQELGEEIAQQLGYEDESGILVASVKQGSRAAREGLRRGDLIIEVNRRRIESVADYERALEESDGTVVLLVVDGRQKFTKFVPLKLPRE